MTVHLRVQERFLTNPVPRKKEFLGSLIPDCKRKHSAQMLRAVGAITIIGVDDRFGIAVGVEGMAEFLQLLPQLQIVVDLAIEDYPRCAVLIMNRLLTPF